MFPFHGAQNAAPVASASQPDIIVVMVDDLGAIDERLLERLPNIESVFLRRGLRFTDAFSETPLCCPGRASFLTGQHTRRHDVILNNVRLLDPRHTIATALDDAGYHTIMVGKYLNGAHSLADHTPPGWDLVAMLDDWSTNLSSDWWIQDAELSAGYRDRFLAHQALTWLTSAPSDKPLFMWLSPHAPHKASGSASPWQPDVEPQHEGDPRCSGIEPWHPPNYALPSRPDGFPLDEICRSLLTVDDMVGALRDEAREQGRDPYWIFMSDNGMAWGADGFALKNVPQAGRLPLYVSGPGVEAGSTSALVSNIDIGPTIAALAGTEMPRADGRSFQRVLRGGRPTRRTLLEDHPIGGESGAGPTGPWWGVRTRRWHLVVWNGVHLFDTEADRWERTDLALDRPEVVKRLAAAVGRADQVQPTPSPSPTPIASPSPSASASASPTPSASPTRSASPTPSASPAPSASPTSSSTPAPTPVSASASPSHAPATTPPLTTRPPAVPPATPDLSDIPIVNPGAGADLGLVVAGVLTAAVLATLLLLVAGPRRHDRV